VYQILEAFGRKTHLFDTGKQLTVNKAMLNEPFHIESTSLLDGDWYFDKGHLFLQTRVQKQRAVPEDILLPNLTEWPDRS